MNKQVQFSVSLCVYKKDNPEWFRAAIESLLNQTKIPDEIIIVIDGPITAELEEVIAVFSENPSIKIIRLQKNSGHAIARQTALVNCSYEYIALMDADDISKNIRFEKQIEKFESDPQLDIVGGQIMEFIDNQTNVVGKRIVPETDDEIKQYLKKRCPMNQVTVMFKKSSVDSVGGYIDWYCEEDYYLWIRMYLAGMKFANVSENLVNVRVGKEMYQRRGGRKYFNSEARLQWYMLRNHVISIPRYLINIIERIIIQLLLPNKLRGWVFQIIART